ncbi:pyridoxamine 5'-phosphate oxidase [soil metagenome]
MTVKSLKDLRIDYTRGGLAESEVDADPLVQFSHWFDQAREVTGQEPNAMTLAIADANGFPSSRIVLLKEFGQNGFVFYTSYASRKGDVLAENPRASLLFYWPELERQVRIEGSSVKVSRAQTVDYFESRPRGSQIAAHLGSQSRVVSSRDELAANYKTLEGEFQGRSIQPPDYWGGYAVVPLEYEFWQGRPNRLHDRIRYRLVEEAWKVDRLGP